MKLFRWQGLIFLAVLFLPVWVFLQFFADGFIQRLIETTGSETAGTEIDVASLSTSLLAPSVRIEKLAVANPGDPRENAVEVDSIRFDVDAGKAVYKKVAVNDMVVDGIRLNQKRKSPAKAYRPPEKKAAEEGAEVAGKKSASQLFGGGLSLPSPQDILKSEKLETLEAADRVKQEIADLKAKWENKLENELSPKALEETREKIRQLHKKAKGGGLADLPATLQELKSLQETIQGNLKKIKGLKAELQRDTRRIKKRVAELKDLPRKDFERLKKKYSLDMGGGANIISTLLGGAVKEKVDKFWRYYELARPYLNGKKGGKTVGEEEKYVRGKGVYVRFNEPNPSPDFLIRRARLSLDLFDTQLAGELKDLSDNQKVYGKPAVMVFQSDQDDKFEKFFLKIKLDRTGPVARDVLESRVKALKLENVEAGEGMRIQKGLADFEGTIEIANENDLSGVLQANLKGLSLSVPPGDGNEIRDAVLNALSSVEGFFIKVSIQGGRDNYSVDIQSDLSSLISGAVRNVVSGKMKGFEKSLKQSITSAAAGPLAGIDGSFGEFLNTDKILKGRTSSWTGLLGQAKKGVSPAPSGKSLPIPKGLKGFKLPF